MFQNIGSKIKAIAFAIFVIGAIIPCVLGLVIILHTSSPLVGLLVIALGVILSYVSSLGLYGYGQLIENTDILVQQSRRSASAPHVSQEAMPEATAKMTVLCGRCGYQFEEKPEDTQPCPHCGATLKRYYHKTE